MLIGKLTSLLLLNVVWSVAAASTEPCADTRVRKEIHDLTDAELRRYIGAVQTLQTTRCPGESDSIKDALTKIHLDQAPQIHTTAHFLPWHRRFLLEWEDKLRTVEPGITVPYWNWTLYADRPDLDPILKPDALGGLVDETNCTLDLSVLPPPPVFDRTAPAAFVPDEAPFRRGCCVISGPQGGLQVPYPSPHCLKRNFKWGTFSGTLANQTQVQNAIAGYDDYDPFEIELEDRLHLFPHGWIGGDFVRNQSPNDILFFLHHGMVDLIWAEWQKLHDPTFTKYGGLDGGHVDAAGNFYRLNATINDHLYLNVNQPFTPRQVMNTNRLKVPGSGACVTVVYEPTKFKPQ